jgi:hypothetical protein
MMDERKEAEGVMPAGWRIVMVILVGGGLLLEFVLKHFYWGLVLQIVGLGIIPFRRRG